MADDLNDIPPALQDCVIDNIRIGRQIGRGANGKILEANWEGTLVAVKEIHSIFMDEVSEREFKSFKRSFLRECEQSSRLRHPNVVRFFGIYWPHGVRVPSLVMERLHCSLTYFLEENAVIPVEMKFSVICDVALGLRYLHTRNPPIIHRDLSSNNVLLSKEMEGKIGDLGTARLVDPKRQSRMTKAPGTVDFMPPEALEDVTNICYGKELDVFSFGCVMLHTLSHQWPTPSQAVIINPDTGLITGGRSEAERRTKYFESVDKGRSDVLIPLIESCLTNLPKNRPSIVNACDHLEGQLVDRESVSVNKLTVHALQQEIQQKDAELQEKTIEIQRIYSEIQIKANEIQQKDDELQSKAIEIQRKDSEIQKKCSEIRRQDVELQWKDTEIQKNSAEIRCLTTALHYKDVLETLRFDISKLQMIPSHPSIKNTNKGSIDFWNNLKLTWQKCAELPFKCWAISLAALNENIYAALLNNEGSFVEPVMYDSSKDQWFILPPLPYANFTLVALTNRKQLLAIGGNKRTDKYSNKVFVLDEKNAKWITPYPDMPTARCRSSCISHKSTVIVAGGRVNPWSLTRAVEVLHIEKRTRSYWSVVEQLPFIVYTAIPLVIDDVLYITQGGDAGDAGDADNAPTTCNVITASIPKLLQSSNKNTSSDPVWNKLPDMPYSSYAINHYQGHLITFGGGHKVELPDKDKPVWQSVPLIHIYNPDTRTWDCVAEIPYEHLLGLSICIKENNIFFIGGLTGEHDIGKDQVVRSCSILTLLPS